MGMESNITELCFCGESVNQDESKQCSKCGITVCSSECLIKHSFNEHQSKDNIDLKPKLSVSKRPVNNNNNNENNKDNIKDIKDFYNYKNFSVVKLSNGRKVLGKGGSAEVCLVKHSIDGKFYAMKIIDKKKKNLKDLITHEINIHLKLINKHIIRLYSASETNDYFYLSLEYAENGNLFSEIKKNGKLSEKASRKYFLQCLEALIYLHSNGLVHRDIKPENLLLDKDMNIKVSDFGGTCYIKEDEERKTFFGTFEYMAPEIIEGGKYNASVDIWAMGILLYEMLHGYSPYRVIEKKEHIKMQYQIYENIFLDDIKFDKNLTEAAIDLIKSNFFK